ncbi:sodium-dependent transporter [Natronorubrum daqingense]|uniref:Daunorubicin ABC transporter ATP-binding protein n=1 Tax=Natronorubrum daqingense TaxID=588898 RepID=A0A1N6XHA6_9EURY|nr:sodium-dependent transporter [Natronorubrum daqingense]APX95952.1 daunorubicin ABC transporter ATP-binding protein [Natronorubrum daqingense]SIR01724.1 neurotransmitter:Na+ symporter, NSS family [Natronorubrum daqingense]
MAQRETWATRTGFILAAVGSAVGLGNIWRFPFVTGEGGGAAFLVVYLLFIALVGFPAILAEFVVGRRTERNPVGALLEYGGNAWKYVGGIFIVTGFVILSYYSVIAGWFIRYAGEGLRGSYADHIASYDGDPELMFDTLAVGLDAFILHTVFMVLTVGIVALGIRKGIELAVKVMVPAIIVLLLGLAVWAYTLPGAGGGYEYYLSPDFGVIADNWVELLPAAAGQAFFTLSLGMGVMITYASYLGKDRNLAKDGGMIIGFDTGIAFLTGLVVFPIMWAGDLTDPGEGGPGEIFVALTQAFAEISGGQFLGLLFFATVAIAALSSAISLLEVVTSYAIDEYGVERWKAAAGMGGAIYLLGVPVTYDLVFLDLLDLFADAILLVFGALMLSILVGWIAPQMAVDELEKGIGELGSIGTLWIWAIRVPIIIVLVVSLYLGIVDYVDFLTGDFAGWIDENL